MFVLSFLFVMIFVGIIRFSIRMAWGAAQIVFSLLAFLISPLVLLVALLGVVAVNWLPLLGVVCLLIGISGFLKAQREE